MFRPKYLSSRLSGGLVSIYSSQMISNIASALLGLFLPIFLFQIFDLKLSYTLIYYLIDYSVYTTFVAVGAKFSLNKLGLKTAIITSTIWAGIYYLAFYFMAGQHSAIVNAMGMNRQQVLILLGLTIFFLNLWRLTYWVPVHTEISTLTTRNDRTRELSILEASSIATNAILPAVAGWLLITFGYNVLFILAVFIFFLSAVPLFALPPIKENFSWTYRQTWKEFFSKKRQKTILAFMGDGAENVVSGIVWPIFIWQILKGNYLSVGAISSAIVLSTVVLELLIGKFADSGKRDKILHWGTFLYALGWIIKIFIDTAFQIFVVSTYQNLARIFTRTPFDSMFYEHAADQGHYVDEYTVIHEMALTVGRILVILLILLLVPYFGIGLTFVLAAIATLLMNLLVDEKTAEEIRSRVQDIKI
jgi:MFS family permease